MRTPNYKVGWLVESKLAALTHFHPGITHEDVAGAFSATQKLLQQQRRRFHIIIDNRLAPLNRIFSLEELQHLSPLLCHPFLQYLVIIEPNHLNLSENVAAPETRGNVCLKNVSSVSEAIDFIQQAAGFKKTDLDISFFENT